jgi:hypothetical protein
MPFEATYGFLLTLGLIAVLIAAAEMARRRRGAERKETL